jgi:hypothetical protein
MIETLRKFWIAILLLAMVSIHAGIIGVIRYKAIQARTSTSCEVDLGDFWIPTETDKDLHLRLHAVVPAEFRIQSRNAFEARQFEIRQAIEVLLRSTDRSMLMDPELIDLKRNVFDVLVQTVGESMINRVVATEVGVAQEQHAFGGFDAKAIAAKRALEKEDEAEKEIPVSVDQPTDEVSFD